MCLLLQVMLLDDETAPYVVGECLVHLPREQVEERLQTGGCHTSPAWYEALDSRGSGQSWLRLVCGARLWTGKGRGGWESTLGRRL